MKDRIELILSLAILLSAILAPIAPVQAQPEWWNNNWFYRRAITITNNVDYDLENFQVNVIIDTATLISQGKMQADGRDIRFVSADGTELPYWIESGINTASTSIWVKIPSIPAHGSITIYIYYGNPTAAPQSSGRDTMLIYEDMNAAPSGSLKGSAYYDEDHGYVVLTQAIHDRRGYLCYYYENLPEKYKGFMIKFRFKTWGGSGADAIWAAIYDRGWSGTLEDVVYGGYHFTFDEYQNRIAFTRSTVSNGPPLASYSVTNIDNGEWHNATIIYYEGHAMIYYDGALVVDHTDSSYPTYSSNFGNYIIFGGRTGGSTNWHVIDEIAVAAYVYPEPSVTIGAEEVYAANITVHITVKNSDGNTFQNVKVQICYAGSPYSEGITDENGKVSLECVPGIATVRVLINEKVVYEEEITITYDNQEIEVATNFSIVIASPSSEITSVKVSNPVPILSVFFAAIPLLAFRRRRAIQTWVAIVLAIIITIAIAVPIYLWVSSFTAPSEAFRPTKFTILDWSVNTTRVDLTLKNLGEYTDALHTIYLKLGSETVLRYDEDTIVCVVTTDGVTYTHLGNIKLKPGAVITIIIPYSLQKGITYTVKIVGKANTIAETEIIG